MFTNVYIGLVKSENFDYDKEGPSTGYTPDSAIWFSDEKCVFYKKSTWKHCFLNNIAYICRRKTLLCAKFVCI